MKTKDTERTKHPGNLLAASAGAGPLVRLHPRPVGYIAIGGKAPGLGGPLLLLPPLFQGRLLPLPGGGPPAFALLPKLFIMPADKEPHSEQGNDQGSQKDPPPFEDQQSGLFDGVDKGLALPDTGGGPARRLGDLVGEGPLVKLDALLDRKAHV